MNRCPFCEEKRPIHFNRLGKGITTFRTNINTLEEKIFEMIGYKPEKSSLEDSHTDCIFLDDGFLGFDNSSGEYAIQFVNINFCPLCGKPIQK